MLKRVSRSSVTPARGCSGYPSSLFSLRLCSWLSIFDVSSTRVSLEKPLTQSTGLEKNQYIVFFKFYSPVNNFIRITILKFFIIIIIIIIIIIFFLGGGGGVGALNLEGIVHCNQAHKYIFKGCNAMPQRSPVDVNR